MCPEPFLLQNFAESNCSPIICLSYDDSWKIMGMMFSGLVKNQEHTGPDSFLPQDNPASVIFIVNFYTRISVHDSVRLLLFAAGFLIRTKENTPVFTLPTRNNPILQGPPYTINPPFYDFMRIISAGLPLAGMRERVQILWIHQSMIIRAESSGDRTRSGDISLFS